MKNKSIVHIGDRHLDPSVNASQFSISSNELANLLQNPNTVSTPVTRIVQSGEGVSYVREVNAGQTIASVQSLSDDGHNIFLVESGETAKLLYGCDDIC